MKQHSFWESQGEYPWSRITANLRLKIYRKLLFECWEVIECEKAIPFFTLIFWFLGKGYQRFKIYFSKQKNLSSKINKYKVKVSHRPRYSKFTPFL